MEKELAPQTGEPFCKLVIAYDEREDRFDYKRIYLVNRYGAPQALEELLKDKPYINNVKLWFSEMSYSAAGRKLLFITWEE